MARQEIVEILDRRENAKTRLWESAATFVGIVSIVLAAAVVIAAVRLCVFLWGWTP